MSTLTTDTSVEHEGITVERLTGDDREQWNEYVREAPGTDFFHQYEALELLAERADARLHPLVGYKGQEPVGLFPAFEIARWGVSTVFSPPPNLWVFYLGPALLNVAKLKQRRREKRHQRFVEGSLEWLDRQVDPKYVHLRTHPRYDDPRPFEWNGFDVTYRYSYVVDLDRDPEDLRMSFSSGARRNAQEAEEAGFEVVEGGTDAIERIIGDVRARHDEQGLSYNVPPSFVVDLYQRLPDQVHPYVCLRDGEFLSGLVVLEHGDQCDRWQGGVKPDDCSVPVNELLDWHAMREAQERGRTRYDFLGANQPSLSEYKSKFDPEVVTYHSIERSTRSMGVLADLYMRLR